MLLDLIDLSKLRHAIFYALTLIVCFIVQDLFLSHITVFGVHALLMPAAVVAIGLFDGGRWGGFIGLFVGYFCDLGHIETTALFTVVLAAAGFFSGVLGKYLLHKGFVSYIVLVLAAMTILTFCQMFPFLFFDDTDVRAVWRTGLIQILWSLPWAVPVYFPIRSIAAAPGRRAGHSG